MRAKITCDLRTPGSADSAIWELLGRAVGSGSPRVDPGAPGLFAADVLGAPGSLPQRPAGSWVAGRTTWELPDQKIIDQGAPRSKNH